MTRLASILALASLTLNGAWLETRSGPFIVYSDAGQDPARAALYHLEQFRFIFGEALGRKDLKSTWPISIIVSKPGKNPRPPILGFSRDGWLATWPAGGAPPPSWFRQLALLFIEENLPSRMPGDLEPTFATLFSTLAITGGKVAIGAPPPAPERTRSWAMLQYLMTNPETAVRTKVLLSNLSMGAEEGAAFRNAFEKPKAVIDAEVDAYLAQQNFRTTTLPTRPIDPDSQFSFIPTLPSRIRVLPGDTLMASAAPPAEIRAAYQAALNERPGPMGFEGLGLACLLEGDKPSAMQAFEAMAKDEAAGARGLYELGVLERVVKLMPDWADPYLALAAKEPGPIRKAFHLKKAAALAPRNPDIWRQLAQASFDAKQFADAEKAWRAAERVARDAAERARLTQAREQFVQVRYDAEAAERARIRKEDLDDVERVRRQSLESIRKAEEAANAGRSALTAKVEKWWDGPATQTFLGTLDSVACQGAKARLSVKDPAGKPAVFAISQPSKVVIFGANQQTVQLACGPQKPPRRVKIEYVPGATASAPREVISVEFQ